jgi:hypothetical protein
MNQYMVEQKGFQQVAECMVGCEQTLFEYVRHDPLDLSNLPGVIAILGKLGSHRRKQTTPILSCSDISGDGCRWGPPDGNKVS